jgi:flagellar basal-body rod protein FlgG
MMRSLTTAAAGMISQQSNLDVIANNLANVNTTAFKQQHAEFVDMMYDSRRASGAQAGNTTAPQPIQMGTGSRLVATANWMKNGPLQATGNPLDMAIVGEGFFQVTRPDGSLAYTRDGSFKTDSAGTLVTNDGMQVQPPITVPTGARAVTVSATGNVSAILPGNEQPQQLGQIQVAVFPNPAGLTRMGQNLYVAGGASGEPDLVEPGASGAGQIQSQFLEGSNVQIVEEMVRMILAQRAYEINSKAIQTSDEMLSTLNNLKR